MAIDKRNQQRACQTTCTMEASAGEGVAAESAESASEGLRLSGVQSRKMHLGGFRVILVPEERSFPICEFSLSSRKNEIALLLFLCSPCYIFLQQWIFAIIHIQGTYPHWEVSQLMKPPNSTQIFLIYLL